MMGRASFARFALCLLPLFASGCLHLESQLVLKPDGSGKVTLYGAIRQPALDRLLMAHSLGADLQAPPASTAVPPPPPLWLSLLNARDSDQAQRLLQAFGTPSLEFQRCTLDQKQDRRDLFIEAHFKSLNDLARCPLFDHLTWRVQSLKDGAIRCTVVLPALPFGKADQPLPPDLIPFLMDLNLVFTVETPAEILETNGQRTTARAARWQFNYDRNPRELRRLDGASLDFIFAATGRPFPQIDPAPAR